MRYHYNGHVLEVRKGPGEWFFSGFSTEEGFRQSPDPTLPMRRSRKEAQVDLDAWAKKKGLEVV